MRADTRVTPIACHEISRSPVGSQPSSVATRLCRAPKGDELIEFTRRFACRVDPEPDCRRSKPHVQPRRCRRITLHNIIADRDGEVVRVARCGAFAKRDQLLDEGLERVELGGADGGDLGDSCVEVLQGGVAGQLVAQLPGAHVVGGDLGLEVGLRRGRGRRLGRRGLARLGGGRGLGDRRRRPRLRRGRRRRDGRGVGAPVVAGAAPDGSGRHRRTHDRRQGPRPPAPWSSRPRAFHPGHRRSVHGIVSVGVRPTPTLGATRSGKRKLSLGQRNGRTVSQFPDQEEEGRLFVGGGDPPVTVLGDDEVGGAVGGDDLEAGQATMAGGPTSARRSATGRPSRDRLRRSDRRRPTSPAGRSARHGPLTRTGSPVASTSVAALRLGQAPPPVTAPAAIPATARRAGPQPLGRVVGIGQVGGRGRDPPVAVRPAAARPATPAPARRRRRPARPAG